MIGLTVVAAAIAVHEALRERFAASIFTGPMLMVGLGLLLSSQLLGVVSLDIDETSAQIVLKATLVILLFTEASEMDARVVRSEAGLSVRLLLAAMPLAFVFGTIAAAVMLGVLSLWEAAVLAVLLAPTHAALGQAVVSNPAVPGTVRRSLIVESGLNDGLAVPFGFIFASVGEILAQESTAADGIGFLLQQIGIGAGTGVAVGWIGGIALSHAAQRTWGSSASLQVSFVALAGVAFAAAEWLGGNGFISVWIAGLAFAIAARPILHVQGFAARSGELLTLLSFFMFGVAILPATFDTNQWEWVGCGLVSLLVVRTVAVALSMIGSRLRLPTVAFLGWFRPRGIASLIIAILVGQKFDLPSIDAILNIVVITVACSVVLHGLTAWPGSQRYGRWIADVGLGLLARYEERTTPTTES
jgi:NhaP-type Na+/H+ or K+/H+ antiporter